MRQETESMVKSELQQGGDKMEDCLEEKYFTDSRLDQCNYQMTSTMEHNQFYKNANLEQKTPTLNKYMPTLNKYSPTLNKNADLEQKKPTLKKMSTLNTFTFKL